ncbi:multifunctional CCA addition/repair protein [Teredinibacter turnerae]|uniref:multifunctional CCA addition/repair protein n=1 Tax=Teredinibacter turnerae TaxID=2426 RepID=UPI00048D3439|nr:multifunctional CCA addition/repair protein [Teredinibacter turnerae]
MKIYLVGGAVRDQLLGYPHHERDWVVVGATPQQMLDAGFKPVGKDFPVFLHPETQEEYALARQERKTAPGYTGFAFHADETVTLEQDLLRRDLTINAIAMDEEGTIIDPYNGKRDIETRTLRHVSQAFCEDPVRILRIARFAARYHHLGFRIAPETLALMRDMVQAGEVDHLVAERVWKELSRALEEQHPAIFIQTLRECGALHRLMPELNALFGIPQPEAHHPEVDTGLHALLALERACELSSTPEVRFAALIHDLGKGVTPKHLWPSHHGHEQDGVALVEQLCNRLSTPNQFRELAVAVCAYHTHCHRAFELNAKTLLKTLLALDGLRRPERFQQFCLCCQADAQGRTGLENRPYPQAAYFLQALEEIQKVDAKMFVAQGKKGAEIGEAMYNARLQKIKLLKTAQTPHE